MGCSYHGQGRFAGGAAATAATLAVFSVFATVLLAAATAAAQVPLPNSPTWLSSETNLYGTGLDIGDITGNGWLDLAVSNGNDMLEAPNVAYFNQDGTLPPAAGWTSGDARFGGHCVLADLDRDGFPELIVANYISAGWNPAQVQVYDNVGGVLASWPSWQTPATLYSFRVTVGDPDGDGDLDLAIATGEAYHGVLTADLVYFNENGTLAAAPGWTSSVADASYDIRFVDIDGDGWQDLATLSGGSQGRVRIYFNQGGVLETSPGWTSDYAANGNTFDFDDLDSDGRLDLLVGYNSQFGAGGFAVYLTAGGELPRSPTWQSAFNGYGSAVICADLDGRNGPDLIAGGWWQPIRVYLNDGTGGFSAQPDWQTASAWSSVVEGFALADLDAGLARTETAVFASGSRLLDLPHRHLQNVAAVTVAGAPLPLEVWCWDRRDGWVSLAEPAAGTVAVTYQVSRGLDLAVSNWDDATYVFANSFSTEAPDHLPALATTSLAAAPNPFNPRTTFVLDLAQAAAAVRLDVFDVRGHRLATLLDGPLAGGRHQIDWRPDGLASGVYLYRFDAGGQRLSGKVVLAR